MALDAKTYFQYLKSYLNWEYYAVDTNMHQELVLTEKIYTPQDEIKINLTLGVVGDAFAIKLDATEPAKKDKKEGKQNSLYHFLNDEGKPWSRRCDFVIFHLYRKSIRVYCMEFKHKSLPVEAIIAQLNSSEAWCKSLQSIINIYTNRKKRLKLSKYVLSSCDEPEKYLDSNNEYLTRDPSVRHYNYADIDGRSLHELQNTMVENIG